MSPQNSVTVESAPFNVEDDLSRDLKVRGVRELRNSTWDDLDLAKRAANLAQERYSSCQWMVMEVRDGLYKVVTQ